MRFLFYSSLMALFALAVGCAPHAKLGLGAVKSGYLVNVDKQGVILQGHDPVSLREGKDTKGSATYSSTYKGAIYHFVSAENKKKFDRTPDQFEPLFGGYCAYGVAVGHLAPIELWTYDTTFQKLNVYQHNQKAVNGWKQDVPGNFEKANAEWAKFQTKYVKHKKVK